MLCGETIALAPYWNKEFPGWEKFKCPSHVQTLVMEAAAAFASLRPIGDTAQRDVGPDSTGELERLRVRNEELGNENRRLESENIGLTSEVEELKAMWGSEVRRLEQDNVGLEKENEKLQRAAVPTEVKTLANVLWEAHEFAQNVNRWPPLSRVQDKKRGKLLIALRELAQLAEPTEPQPVPADVGPDSGDELQLLPPPVTNTPAAADDPYYIPPACDRTRH